MQKSVFVLSETFYFKSLFFFNEMPGNFGLIYHYYI